MKYEIKNRFTREVQFTAEIDCEESAPRSLKVGLSVKCGLKYGADLTGADLTGADLSETDLFRADLSRSNLSRSDLSETDLSGADLTRSDLSGVNLSGANYIADRIIDGGLRSDGYRFLLILNEGVRRIQAGCRDFTVPEGVKHWESTRKDTPLGDETFAIIEHMTRIADLRKWNNT